ncbi:hypothetical protein Asi02nite_45870 [Asanoa siamensis]|uniref:Uncharacterized protein n=1 Tax=Asanoa siamensis TaxID=926357 RepID=A0ABQ4CUV6_9ACTN|nr:hypothetical protein Asi02nite_45870 [Asanoa siamensis]
MGGAEGTGNVSISARRSSNGSLLSVGMADPGLAFDASVVNLCEEETDDHRSDLRMSESGQVAGDVTERPGERVDERRALAIDGDH